VIEVDIVGSIDDFTLGALLTAANMAIVGLLIYANTARYLRQRKERHRNKARQAETIEWAVGFNKIKFKTTLEKVEGHLPPTHALVYWYGSMPEVEAAIRTGLRTRSSNGVSGAVVTLHRPHELNDLDVVTFPKREAVLPCAVPWQLLEKHNESVQGEDRTLSALCVLPVEVLTALRGSHFGAVPNPQPWFEGGVFLPPQQIVRAYQLVDVGTDQGKAPVADGLLPPLTEKPFADGLRVDDKEKRLTRDRSSTFGYFEGVPSLFGLRRSSSARPSAVLYQPGAVCPATCLQFANHMGRLRAVCGANGWELVYHYTQPKLLPLILKTGFRMSTQGQGDGGVYFSTLGPAAYEVGTDLYEENIIIDCFGPERLEEYRGKGMLDMCLVYGAEAAVLSQAPGEGTQE
jgi:hypothetical protein